MEVLRTSGGGITKLSELEIDVNKDWAAKRITNVGAPTLANDVLRRRGSLDDMPDMVLDKIMVGQGPGSSPVEEDKPAGAFGIWKYRKAGDHNWHGFWIGKATTTQTLTANYISAVPFYIAVDRTITGIGVEVTIAGTQNTEKARLGIYDDDGTIYPGDLISDCGEIDVSGTGAKTITGLTINLTGDKLYWLVLATDSNATYVGYESQYAISMRGSYWPTPDNSSTWFIKNLGSYGALPATFPSGATEDTTKVLCLAVRWS